MEKQRMVEFYGETFDLNAIQYIKKAHRHEWYGCHCFVFKIGFKKGEIDICYGEYPIPMAEIEQEINKIRDELIGMLSVEKIMQII